MFSKGCQNFSKTGWINKTGHFPPFLWSVAPFYKVSTALLMDCIIIRQKNRKFTSDAICLPYFFFQKEFLLFFCSIWAQYIFIFLLGLSKCANLLQDFFPHFVFFRRWAKEENWKKIYQSQIFGKIGWKMTAHSERECTLETGDLEFWNTAN